MAKLDFIVFGMPRSGTSATARYLSAIDGIHCGQEVFPLSLDHSRLDVPRAFVERQHDKWNDSSAEIVAAKGDSIRYWGNKTPTYFYRLEQIMEELGQCPAVVCLRAPQSVAQSYSTRAQTERDRWHAGRRGLYAAGDALMLAHVLAAFSRPQNILVLPQNALLHDWKTAMARVAAHVAPGHPVSFDADVLGRIDQIKARQTKRKKLELEKVERNALKRLDRTGLSDFFDRHEIGLLADVQPELKSLVAHGPPNPVGFMRRLAADHPAPEARAYFQNWSAPAARAWSRLRTGAQGDKTHAIPDSVKCGSQ